MPTPPSHLHIATALAHMAPASLLLRCWNGAVLTVAYHRLDAFMDPCLLRSALLAPPPAGEPALADVVKYVHVASGLEDLGGGLYRRCGEDGEERWFATTLPLEEVGSVLDRCPIPVPDQTICASVKPDVELGITIVELVAHDPAFACRLDEVGFWAVAACMVQELLLDLEHAADR